MKPLETQGGQMTTSTEVRCKHCKATDAEIKLLRSAIEETLSEHSHLADGENCTLIRLKRALQGRNWPTPIPDAWVLWEELPNPKHYGVNEMGEHLIAWYQDYHQRTVNGSSFPDAVTQAWLTWKKGEK